MWIIANWRTQRAPGVPTSCNPSPEEVEAALGYVIGGVAPFPPHAETRTIVDADAAATMNTVYCGIGRADRTLEIAIADVIAVANADVASVVQAQTTT